MATLTEIYEFLSHEIGVEVSRIKENSDLLTDLGVDGDDFFELMEAFEKWFPVDLSNYLWYFHHHEEGFLVSFTTHFFEPKNLPFISVTPALLLECVNTGKWPLQYPEHPPRKPPPYKLILCLNILFIPVGGFVIFLLISLFRKLG